MDRIKTFFRYFLIFMLVYFLVSFLSFCYIKTTYKKIDCVYKTDKIDIQIEKAEATRINGNIKLKVNNNTKDTIENKYIKIDFYSKNENNMGSKYIKIGKLEPNSIIEEDIQFRIENVKTFSINLVESSEKIEEEAKISEEEKGKFAISTILALMFFGMI